MAEITAALVKALRDKTDAGMMDCKKALNECNGDMDAAVKYLREKGIAKAAAKADRDAKEGVIRAAVAPCGCSGIILELNCETDFCAKGDKFQGLVNDVANALMDSKASTLEEALQVPMAEGSTEEYIKAMCSSIGENMALRKFARLTADGIGAVVSYIHMGGKIGVLVDMTGGDEELGKDVAMQIAAAAPAAIDRSGVDAAALEHEKEVLRKQALEEGKPEKIVERMVEGRINKYYKEVCLNEQIFVKDSDKTVKDILGDVKVTAFTRYQLGEGIEKKQENFAAEVAAQMK